MDFLDIIGKVIEFSEKGEEYSDEIKAFKATLESLQLTVQHVEPRDMPTHLSGMLSDNLAEAKDLLNKAGNSGSGWMANIRNMLPGSQLQKIKEKNQQLVHIITLINLHLNSLKSTKRHLETAYTTDFDADEPAKLKKLHTLPSTISSKTSLNMPKKSASENTSYDALYGPTLDTTEEDGPDLNGATQADNPDEMVDDGDFAFRLRVIYDERLGKVLKNCKDFEAIIEKRWEGKTTLDYIFQRLSFAYLPVEDATRISRDHATLTAIKKAGGKKKEDLAVSATVPDDDKMYGATIADDGGDENMNGNGAGDYGGNEIILKDLSLNGTYYMKRGDLLNFPPGGMKIKGDFKILAKNEETTLEHGDIIGLIMQKPQNKDLIFGFQLLTE